MTDFENANVVVFMYLIVIDFIMKNLYVGRDRIDEVEPEWFSGGPTSQSETIELVGFEEQNDDDNRKSKKSSKKAKQNSRRSSLKSEEGEKIETVASADDQPSQKKGMCNFLKSIYFLVNKITFLYSLIIIRVKIFDNFSFSFVSFYSCNFYF